jgi:acyl-coenzyme A synthetase/AMP-(fatty) acid ligase
VGVGKRGQLSAEPRCHRGKWPPAKALTDETGDSAGLPEHVTGLIGTECGASFKVPRRVIFRSDWPLTESGKIQKFELKKTLGNGSDGNGLVGLSG